MTEATIPQTGNIGNGFSKRELSEAEITQLKAMVSETKTVMIDEKLAAIAEQAGVYPLTIRNLCNKGVGNPKTIEAVRKILKGA